MVFETTWSQFKQLLAAKSMKLQFIESDQFYKLYAFDGPFGIHCLLNKDASADTVEFETSYQSQGNKKIENKTQGTGAVLLAQSEAEGFFETYISHDWTDKCTWWGESQRVSGGSASSNSGLAYQMPHTFLIDLEHGRVTYEEFYADDHRVKAYDNGTEVQIDSVDYEAGIITLASAPAGAVTFDYSYSQGSGYSLKFQEGQIVRVNRAGVQFTKDVGFKPMKFEVIGYAYNPATGQLIMHPQTGLPFKAAYETVYYKSIKDVVNLSNLGLSVPAFAGLQNEVVIFTFEYQRPIDIRPDLQMEIRISTIDDEPMTGEFATASIYIVEVPFDS